MDKKEIIKYLATFYTFLENEELMKNAFLIQKKPSTSN